jgi:hypothetical protein
MNAGVLKINNLKAGEIISLSCQVRYKGRCKEILYPSISVAEVLALSSKANLLHGALIIDEDYGFYFPLPSPYDELADSIAHVPEDVGLNGLHVENIHWWFKPALTPSYAKPPAN